MSSINSRPAQVVGRGDRLLRGWTRAGERAAHIFGIILFAVLYVVALAPLAVILKLTGKKLLPRFTGNETSYYLKKEPIEPTLEHALRQW